MTVQEIVQRAGIHRSTFYIYFQAVEDIFSGIKEHQLSLLQEVLATSGEGEEKFIGLLNALREVYNENRVFLKPLVIDYHSSTFSRAYRQMLKDALKSDGNFPVYTEGSREYIILDSVMSGYIEMLLQLLDSDTVSMEEAFRFHGGSIPFCLLYYGKRDQTGSEKALRNHINSGQGDGSVSLFYVHFWQQFRQHFAQQSTIYVHLYIFNQTRVCYNDCNEHLQPGAEKHRSKERKEPGMIKIFAKMLVKEECIDKFIELAKELVEKSRAEEGNVFYSINQSVENNCIFAFIECWKDQAAIDFHNATPHFTGIVPQLGSLCEKSYGAELFNEL